MNADRYEDKRAQGLPILGALRTEPLRGEDSGWQFLYYFGPDEDEDHAQVWAVSEVLSLVPNLNDFIDSPVGTALRRRNKNSK